MKDAAATLVLLALSQGTPSAAVSRPTSLPAGSSLSPAAFQRALAALDVSAPRVIADEDAGGARRRLLAVPDEYYEECVFQVNAARAKEGLPILQRWRDFERCSDRGVKYDAKQNSYHAAANNGLFCDWATYKNVAQNSCPKWFTGIDAISHCNDLMWAEKDLLVKNSEGKLECEDGSPADECAGHYLNLRGGEFGYNAYDRVACGFYVQTDPDTGYEELWINQNFGMWDGREPSPANEWTAPDGWVPADVRPYGYECGGDSQTKPASLLEPDCPAELDAFQYNGCAGEARRDYRWWGCVFPHCDMNYDGPCKDLTVGSFFEIYYNDEPEGYDICSDLNADPLVGPLSGRCLSSEQYYFIYPEGTRRSFHTNKVCRRSCDNCGCETAPFDVGFTPFPTPAPTTPMPTPVPDPTVPPTEAFDCTTVPNKRNCKKTHLCRWTDSDSCMMFDGDCATLSSRNHCRNAYGCTWSGGCVNA